MRYTLAECEDALVRGTAEVGKARLTVCTDGTARFDGGAMFGVVPKALWQQRMPADEQNRVRIGLNCVVVRAGGKTVLIETGFGNKLKRKLQNVYATQGLLPQSLAAAGVSPGEVDVVINTHLHWDHCGWNTVLEADGAARPFFPKAQYVAHRREVEHGRLRTERDGISYVAENYEPLLATRQMRTVDLEADGSREEVVAGVSVECFPGHTERMLAVHVESEGEHACFVSDLIPTAAHLDLTWVMGFDLDPLRTIAERKRFFSRAVAEQWLVVFPHDHTRPLAHLERDGVGPVRAKPY